MANKYYRSHPDASGQRPNSGILFKCFSLDLTPSKTAELVGGYVQLVMASFAECWMARLDTVPKE